MPGCRQHSRPHAGCAAPGWPHAEAQVASWALLPPAMHASIGQNLASALTEGSDIFLGSEQYHL